MIDFYAFIAMSCAAILVFSACTCLPLTSLAVLCPSVAIGMSLSKFGPPSLKGDSVDVGKVQKLAQRVEEALNHCLFAA